MSAVAARALVVLAAVLFSTGGAAIKATTLSGFAVAGSRSLVAAGALVLLLRPGRALRSWRVWLVGLAYAGTMVLFVLGNKLTTAANTIYLQSTAPLVLLFAAPLLLGERSSRRDLGVGALMAVGLVVMLHGEEPASAIARDPALGNMIGLADGVAWALTLLGLRWLSLREGPSAAAAAAIAGNVLALAIAAPLAVPWPTFRTADALVVAYLGVFQIGLAYAALTRAIRHVRALEAGVLLLLEPLLAPLWAHAVHGETPSSAALAGGALILAAATVQALAPHAAGAAAAGS